MFGVDGPSPRGDANSAFKGRTRERTRLVRELQGHGYQLTEIRTGRQEKSLT